MSGTRTNSRTAIDRQATVDLLARVRNGDRSAENTLIQRNLHELRRFARGRVPPAVRGHADTEDLVQGAVMRAIKHLSTFDAGHPGAFQGYLRTCFKNLIVDELRHAIRHPASELPDPDLIQDPAPSPMQLAIARETVVRYKKALTALRPADRALVVARLERGWTYGKMGQAFGKTEDAARVAVGRAIQRLVKSLKTERISATAGTQA